MNYEHYLAFQNNDTPQYYRMRSPLSHPSSFLFRSSWCRYLPCVASALSSLPSSSSSRPFAVASPSSSPLPHLLVDSYSRSSQSPCAFISSENKPRYLCRRYSSLSPSPTSARFLVSESRHNSISHYCCELTKRRHRRLAATSSSLSLSSKMNTQSSHSQTTNSSTSSSSSSSNNNKFQTPHPPLIDVDCNLLHPDLISILDDSYLSTPAFQSRFPPDLAPETTSPLSILHHPSTTAANIAAVISPSSTIEESRRNVRLLETVRAHLRDEVRPSSPREDDNHPTKPLHVTNGIQIKTTVGVHPYHTQSVGPPDDVNLAKLRALLDKTRDDDNVIACIGETGLDYSPGFPTREHQLPWFRAQLDLAWEYNLPLFLHERAAFEDAIRCIDEAEERHRRDNHNSNNNNVPNKQAAPKILIHCFTGTYNECLDYIQRGYHISLSGYVLKPGNAEDPASNHDAVRKCLRDGILPWNKLMIETDAPYMGFESCRETFYEAERRWAEEEGKESPFGTWKAKKKKSLRKGTYPNVPGALDKVLEGVWEEINAGRRERGEEEVSLEELARITTENAVRFFGLEEVDWSAGVDSVYKAD